VAVAVASLQLMRPSLLALSSRPALLAALLQGPVAVPPAEALAGAHALRAGPAMRGALEAARAGAALEALVAGALGEALRLLDAPASTDALESALAGWVGAGGAAPCGVGGVSVCGGAAEVAAVFSRASPACLARACSPPAAPRTGWGDAALLPAAAGRDAGVERLGSGAWAVRGAAGGGSELVARAALQNGSWLVVWRPLTDLSAAAQPLVPAPPARGCGAFCIRAAQIAARAPAMWVSRNAHVVRARRRAGAAARVAHAAAHWNGRGAAGEQGARRAGEAWGRQWRCGERRGRGPGRG